MWPCRYPGPFGLDVRNAQDTWDFLWLWKCGRVELASTYRVCEKCSQLLAQTGSLLSWKVVDRQCPGPCSDLVHCQFNRSSSMGPPRTRFPSVFFLLEGYAGLSCPKGCLSAHLPWWIWCGVHRVESMRPPSPVDKTPCYQTCVLGALFLLLLLASLRLFAFGCSFPSFFSLFFSRASFL